MNTNKILIVEDNKDYRFSLSVRFRASGYQVVDATDAISAISLVRKESPDPVILDLGLPAGDGRVVTELLKTLPQTASIPILVLTARDVEDSQERAYEAGSRKFPSQARRRQPITGLGANRPDASAPQICISAGGRGWALWGMLAPV